MGMAQRAKASGASPSKQFNAAAASFRTTVLLWCVIPATAGASTGACAFITDVVAWGVKEVRREDRLTPKLETKEVDNRAPWSHFRGGEKLMEVESFLNVCNTPCTPY